MAKKFRILCVIAFEVGLFFILNSVNPAVTSESVEKTFSLSNRKIFDARIYDTSFPNEQDIQTSKGIVKYDFQDHSEKLNISDEDYSVKSNLPNIPVQNLYMDSENENSTNVRLLRNSDLSENEISEMSNEHFSPFNENNKNEIYFENSNSVIDNTDYRLDTNSTFTNTEHLSDDTVNQIFLNNNVQTTDPNSHLMFDDQNLNANVDDDRILQPHSGHNQMFWPNFIEGSKYNDIISNDLPIPDEIDINLDKPDVEAVQYSSVVRVLTKTGHHTQHSSVHASSTNLNELIDFILQYVRNEIVAKGEDQIKIPDIHETFKKKIGFIKVKGSFDGDNGWFRKLSTIHRTADVIVTRKELSLEVVCALGLSTMEFGFSHYKAELEHIRVSGHLDGHIGKNSLSLKVTVGIVHGTCKITLDKLKLVEFGDIKVKATGLGKLSFLLSDMSTWAAKHFREKIVSRIEESLSQAVSETLSKAHCSQSLLDHLQSYENHGNKLNFETNQ